MPFAHFDSAAITRALADVFFERREEVELPPAEATPGFRVWQQRRKSLFCCSGSWAVSCGFP